jgi:hypothetical protein
MGGDYFDESDAGDDLAEIWAQTVCRMFGKKCCLLFLYVIADLSLLKTMLFGTSEGHWDRIFTRSGVGFMCQMHWECVFKIPRRH